VGAAGIAAKGKEFPNLAMLTALNRPAELAIHVRGAVNNGISKEEIMETLLHTAIYCGVPAAMESFKVARQVLDEMKKA
jgi:4-carboxymuconolactone decarboxylase